MKKLLITAFIGSANLGDNAIFVAISQHLLSNKTISLSAFTSNIRRHTHMEPVRFIQTINPIRIISEIARCDLLVIGGGGIIQDETTAYNLIRHTYKALIAILLRKKFMFYAVGVSRLRSLVNRMLARFVLERAVAVTVRDEESKNIIRSLGVDREVFVTADPVVNLRINKLAPFPKSPKRYIVVCLRHWFDINRYIPVAVVNKIHYRSQTNKKKYEAFLAVIAPFFDWLVSRYNYTIMFMPFFDQRDDVVHADVMKHMKQPDSCINIGRQPSLEEVYTRIAGASFVLGMRLHSLIISSTQNTPFIALTYARKVSSFVDELSLSTYSLGLEKLTVSELEDVCIKLHSERTHIQSTLKRRLAVLQRREKSNVRILRKVLTAASILPQEC